MQFERLLCSIQKDFTTVQVSFKGSSSLYTYKAPLSLGLVEGDTVVVPASGKFELVRVKAVHRVPKLLTNEDIVLQWVVQKVDFSPYNELVEKEAQLREQLEDVLVQDMQSKALQAFTSNLAPEALERFKQLAGS